MKRTAVLTALLAAGVFAGAGTLALHAQDTEPLVPLAEDAASAPADSAPAEEMPDSANVEVGVNELQQLVGAPKGASLKRESDEDPSKPIVILTKQRQDIIWGTSKPKFIYYPEGVDPMLIPWVRERVIAEEKFQEAMVAKSARDWDKAKALLQEIKEKYASTDFATKTDDELKAIQRLVEQEAAQKQPKSDPTVEQPPKSDVVDLPLWIRNNTTAVLVSANSIVMVGDDMLKVGESVPRYAGVKVKSIETAKVVFTYQGLDFPVDVQGSF